MLEESSVILFCSILRKIRGPSKVCGPVRLSFRGSGQVLGFGCGVFGLHPDSSLDAPALCQGLELAA